MNTTRRWLTHLSAFFFVLFMAFGLTSYADDGMKVHFLNVGQADSTLITCGDHAMLIDAGKNDDKEPILNYIQNKAGLTHLDYMIGTHPHEDHIGSMDSVIEAVSVDTVMLPNVTANTRTFQDVLTAIDEKGLSITVPEVGETYSLGDASFTILGPVSDYGDNLNDWSIALKITYGNTSFIFTGDAEADAEADMLGTGLDLSADVYQVGHHGSRTSSSSALLDAISPRYAVISCGAGNDYGHPHQETLDALSARNIEVYRTDLLGTIVAATDGNSISFSTAFGSGSSGSSSENQSSSSSTTVISDDGQYSQDNSASSSDVTVHITKTGEKYHSAGCQYLKKSDIEVTLSEAKARGLTPCSRCNPPQ